MPYYKDAQQMYAQSGRDPTQPHQRVTPLVPEMYSNQQMFQSTSPTDSVTDFFTKYMWWIIAIVVILIIIGYFWYSSKNTEKLVEF